MIESLRIETIDKISHLFTNKICDPKGQNWQFNISDSGPIDFVTFKFIWYRIYYVQLNDFFFLFKLSLLNHFQMRQSEFEYLSCNAKTREWIVRKSTGTEKQLHITATLQLIDRKLHELRDKLYHIKIPSNEIYDKYNWSRSNHAIFNTITVFCCCLARCSDALLRCAITTIHA